MPCDVMRKGREAMAKAGWSDEEITALENEVTLARRKAQATAYNNGMTLKEQQALMKRAENEVYAEAHDRHHREMADAMKEINRLAEFRRVNPNTHYGAAERLKTAEILDSIVSDHAGVKK